METKQLDFFDLIDNITGVEPGPTLVIFAKEIIVMAVHTRPKIKQEVYMKKYFNNTKISLKEFVRGLIAIGQIYQDDEQEMSKAVGRYFDNFCNR